MLIRRSFYLVELLLQLDLLFQLAHLGIRRGGGCALSRRLGQHWCDGDN